ncbi:MAG: hypothetical protein ACOYYS_14230 [Chloroflexota bacterium]
MNTNIPSTHQWTIRIFPWLLWAILIALGFPLIWLVVTNPQARCGGLILLPVLLTAAIGLGEVVTCRIDLETRTVTLRRASILRREQHRFSFDDIQTISVQSDSGGESITYRLVFALQSGQIIPLTKTSSSGKGGKEKLAQQIAAYINQARFSPIRPALDGVVRIENGGETDGVRWQIAIVTANDNVPLTRWHTTQARFSGGFILLMPAMPAMRAQTASMPGGLAGSIVRAVYGRYLRMLDLSDQDMPGFANAQFLTGDQVGLEKRFAILTSDPVAAKAWLTPSRAGRLAAWMQSNPLEAAQAESDPHLWLTAQGLWLAFRGRYNRPEQVAAIAQLGADLAKE